MTVLDNDSFLTQLTKLFEKTKPTSKKVYLTMKRHTWESRNAKKVREAEEKSKAVDDQSLEKDLKKEDVDDKEYPCLFRAECGKIKISFTV
ncbi:10997_t:CDS:2 [Funneliformis mosseae]|uniref:Signal recognition particle subunit SRP14 n=1 Tax=Funneliformis mosseae TaxID=27381 RepID=A0A9N9D8A5_FUNMO|nr:10997_t:CDS:2 [Funneliformis mosseae]